MIFEQKKFRPSPKKKFPKSDKNHSSTAQRRFVFLLTVPFRVRIMCVSKRGNFSFCRIRASFLGCIGGGFLSELPFFKLFRKSEKLTN